MEPRQTSRRNARWGAGFVRGLSVAAVYLRGLEWKRGRQRRHSNVNLDGIVGESTKNRFGARIIGIVTAANHTDPAIWSALAECDTAEFRADGFPAAAIAREARDFKRECLRRLGRPLETLLTIRLKRDGGAWADSQASLREPVWRALGLDGSDPACDWIDVEVEEFASLPAPMSSLLASGSAKLLLSHHDMGETLPLPGLRALSQRMRAFHPAGMKFAMTCASKAELTELMGFAREVAAATPNGCVLSMGGAGRATRVLAPLLGCPFTYGYLTGGAVAPGQLSALELARFYRGISGPPAAGKNDSQLLDWAEARIEGDMLAD